jgi:hypothetical protein
MEETPEPESSDVENGVERLALFSLHRPVSHWPSILGAIERATRGPRNMRRTDRGSSAAVWFWSE